MKVFVSFAIIAATVMFSCYPAQAQDSKQTSDDDVIAAKIIVTPKLDVPKEALETGLGGTIRVKISIDESGSISAVDDVVGPGPVCRQVTRPDVVAMRNAAKEAASQTRFSPAMKDGKAVESYIWLNFAFPGRQEKPDFDVSGARTASSDDKNKYTVKGDPNFSVAPPPDYARRTADGTATATGSSSGTLPKTIPGGVLNGKAKRLPKPAYPPAARAVRASGAVTIQVLIDENGDVFSASAVSGHPLLRSASTIAACESKFSPTTLSGDPVKVAGIITYNFVP
jgi:outer membrane biosynthesis protein TonB